MPEVATDQAATAEGVAREMMEVRHLSLNTIEVGDRMRSLDRARVDALAASIKEINLQVPITVTMNTRGGAATPRLVVGHHRLKAAEQLGWDRITCFVTMASELDCELWEIDENLVRATLTELEQSQHLKRRKEIFDSKGEEKIRTPGGAQEVGFDKSTADATGLDKSTVRKSRRRAEKIDPQVQSDIAGTSIATKGAELDALASMTPDDQAQAVEMVQSGKAASIREAGKAITPGPQKKKRRGRNAAQERAHFWRKLREALENVIGMPDTTTIINAVPAVQREMVTNHLPIVIDWLDDFRSEWTIKQVGTGDLDAAAIEMRAINRAWDRISDDARKAFAANLKERGWL